eukprot:gene10646-biopygen9284
MGGYAFSYHPMHVIGGNAFACIILSAFCVDVVNALGTLTAGVMLFAFGAGTGTYIPTGNVGPCCVPMWFAARQMTADVDWGEICPKEGERHGFPEELEDARKDSFSADTKFKGEGGDFARSIRRRSWRGGLGANARATEVNGSRCTQENKSGAQRIWRLCALKN